MSGEQADSRPKSGLDVVVSSTAGAPQGVVHSRRSPKPGHASAECDDWSSSHKLTQRGASASSRWQHNQILSILRFALPALSIVLVDPLMTLLDTVLIGQFATTDQLAALGPNTLVFNAAQWIFNSLAVGTTSVIAQELVHGRDRHAGHLFTIALGMGLLGGLLEMVLFKAFAFEIIRATGAPERLVHAAARYMTIRATAAPALLVTLVVQAVLLAQKDATTPFRAVMVSSALKVALTLVLLGADSFGMDEAGMATVASQYTAVVLLLYWNSRDRDKVQPGWGFRLTLANIAPFAECLGPLTGVYVLKNVCYMLINSAATSQTFLAVAAHQSMMSIWVLLAFCATPLERAAITFLPTTRAEDLVGMETLLARMAFVLGIATGVICAGAAVLCPELLTQDERVWGHFSGIAPQAFISLTANALDAAFNGILLARREYTFLLGAMGMTLAVLFGYNTWLLNQGSGLAGVWWGLVLFVALRCAAVFVRYRLFTRQ